MAKKNKIGRQKRLVIGMAAAIITASILSTLYFTGFFPKWVRGDSPGYQNITFTDAYRECATYTRQRYANRLQHLSADNHSSRYANSSNLYKIYFNVQMSEPSSPRPGSYWVSCYVDASDGQITEYDLGDSHNAPVQPSNGYGWP